MTEQEAIYTAKQFLNGVFYNPEHLRSAAAEEPVMPTDGLEGIWETLQKFEDNGTLDTARVRAALYGSDTFKEITSEETASLIESTSHAAGSERLVMWAKNLRSHAAKIRLGDLLARLGKRVPGSSKSIDEIASHVLKLVTGEIHGAQHGGFKHISDIVDLVIEDTYEWEQGVDKERLPTGFYSLDDLIEGYPVGEITLMAALSGAGKTAFALQALRQVAIAQLKRQQRGEEARAVAMLNIEMTDRQVGHRLAASHNRINLREIRGSGDVKAIQTYRELANEISDLPIYIDSHPKPTIDQIHSRLYQINARHDIALIVVDYDEKAEAPETRSEEQRVAAISKGLKVIAKDIGAACLVLSQYNSESATYGYPSDNWLRYSRKKFHEAHTILHWWWPGYWVSKGDDPKFVDEYDKDRHGYGKIMVTKNRGGPPGNVDLEFIEEYTLFRDPNDPMI